MLGIREAVPDRPHWALNSREPPQGASRQTEALTSVELRCNWSWSGSSACHRWRGVGEESEAADDTAELVLVLERLTGESSRRL
jgi:hypothetical protein